MNGVLINALRRALPAAVICLLLIVAGCVQEESNGDAVGVAGDTSAAADTSGGGGIPADVDPVVRGERSYVQYCASCHGREGRGDGPVAEVMTTPPADLTQLRTDNGGYPVDSVYAYIDGRADILAHGTREMPVWGNVWGEVEGQPVPREEVDQRINELVEYIRSLQEEEDTSDDGA